MQRYFLVSIALLEFAVAGLLGYIGQRLPSSRELTQNFNRVADVTTSAEQQVASIQQQVGDLRASRTRGDIDKLTGHVKTIANVLEKQKIEHKTLVSLRDGLDETAIGLQGFSNSLDPKKLEAMSQSLGITADYLEKNVAVSAQQAAIDMEKATASLERDAKRLGELLRKAPPDLKALKAIHDSLADFEKSSGILKDVFKLERLDAITEGFTGMETAMSTSADQAEKMSRYTYPVVKLNGFRPPEVEMKSFWPEGGEIAEGLRKAIKGLQATNQELVAVNKQMPAFRESIEESRRAMTKTREAMASTLKQQAEMEKLLASVPEQSATLSEELPRIGKSFSKMLRETEKFTEVAKSLRMAKLNLDSTADQWPILAANLSKSSSTLRGMRDQIDKVVQRHPEYEKALNDSMKLAESLSQTIPHVSAQLDGRLEEQEQTLTQLRTGLHEVNEGLPGISNTASELISTISLLLWVVAGLIALHGAYVLVDCRLRQHARPTTTQA